MKLKAAQVVMAAVALAAAPRMVSATVVDFEGFADFANIEGVNLGGVTITNPGGNVEIFDDRFGVAYHSATKAIGSFGQFAVSHNPMVFTFDVAQALVSLWGGDGGNDSDSWTLNAYDAAVGGALVGTASSGIFDGNPYVQLSVAAPAIWRVEAIWTGPDCCGIGYDDLEFQAVPEPGSLALLAFGLAGVARARRRSQRA